jgi:hypothetical protein
MFLFQGFLKYRTCRGGQTEELDTAREASGAVEITPVDESPTVIGNIGPTHGDGLWSLGVG